MFILLLVISLLVSIPDVLTRSIEVKYVRENDFLNISCSSFEKIGIVSALFYPSSECNCSTQFQMDHSRLCCGDIEFVIGYKALQAVQTECNNRSYCFLQASEGQLRVDRCQHCVNNLQVSYTCESITPFYEPTVPYRPTAPSTRTSFYTPTLSYRKCPQTSRHQVNWTQTLAGYSVTTECPNNKGLYAAKWKCGTDPVGWIGQPDLSECVSSSISNLWKKVNATKAQGVKTDVVEISRAMTQLTSNNSLLGGDLDAVVGIMNDLVVIVNSDISLNKSSTASLLCESIVNTSSNLLSDNQLELWKSVDPSSWPTVASQIMSAVEDSAFLMGNGSSAPAINASRNIIVSAGTVSKNSSSISFYSSCSSCSSWNGRLNVVNMNEKLVSELAKSGYSTLVISMFNNLETYLSGADYSDVVDNTTECLEPNCTQELFINTNIISASVDSCQVCSTVLKEPIVFTLQHKQDANESSPVCAYWNFSTGLSSGSWSRNGCKVKSFNVSHTTCACQHLTFYAVLMSPTAPRISKDHVMALSVITYIGLSISIVCLVLSFMTFTFFRNLSSDRNTIHKNLAINLLLANVLFLAGSGQSGSPIPVACRILAGITHFLFLTSFSWMCLEGAQLYVMLVEVFESPKSRLHLYYIFAYGCPAVIVGVAAAINHEGYGTEAYCWLSTDRGFIWSFIGPVIVVILMNSIMLGMALRIMYQHATSAAWQYKTRAQQMGSWIKGAVTLEVLLGLTWAFGFAYVNEQTLVLAYIFTILNSLQGLFIFLFHCVFSDKVRVEYQKCISRTEYLPECCRAKCDAERTSKSNNSPSGNYLTNWFTRRRTPKNDPVHHSQSDTKSTSQNKKSLHQQLIVKELSHQSEITLEEQTLVASDSGFNDLESRVVHSADVIELTVNSLSDEQFVR